MDIALVYDNRSGFYAGGSVIGEATRHQGAEVLGHQEYAGYANRLPDGSTLDLGVDNLNYRSFGQPFANYDTTDVYAGRVMRLINYYLHYSPNYFRRGARILYGEVNGAIRLPSPLRPLRAFAHMGALTPLGGSLDTKERYDLRFGIAAALKHGDAELAWSTARPAYSYAEGASQERGVLALGMTWNF